MLTVCWSVKGGSGTTVLAASIAALLGEQGPTQLVDLDGDLAAALGVAEVRDATGVAEWLRADDSVPGDALDALVRPLRGDLSLVPVGMAVDDGDHAPARRWEALAQYLASVPGDVVVDAGVIGPSTDPGRRAVVQAAGLSLLVLRPCYLALRRAVHVGLRPTGVLLVKEPGRALGVHDVEQTLGVPVRAEIDVDPAVARVVDAGLLLTRMPRAFERSVRRAA